MRNIKATAKDLFLIFVSVLCIPAVLLLAIAWAFCERET
jgi:hypothetical protein